MSGSPIYLLDLDELHKDIMGLSDVTVDGGEDEVVVAGTEVARDVVVVCRRGLPSSMCMECCNQGRNREYSSEV
jgi:hypothetical protein